MTSFLKGSNQMTTKFSASSGSRKRIRLDDKPFYTAEELFELIEAEQWTDDDLEYTSELSSDEDERQDSEVAFDSDNPLPESHKEEVLIPLNEKAMEVPEAKSDLKWRQSPETCTWTKDRSHREEFPFVGNPGVKEFPVELSPFGFFKLFFSFPFMEYLAKETNNFAEVVFLSSAGTETARISQWHDTSVDELYTFFGIMFFMGLVRINRIRNYWLTHYLFNLEVKKYMSRDRYLLLFRCLHFAKNDPKSPLNKISPILDYFNSTMEKLYYPDKNLCINESMAAWQGHLRFRQYSQNKNNKNGMKLHILAEPNGMIQSLHIYGGADDPEVGGKDHAAKVVKKLMLNKTGVGHAIYMDSYYNSVPLANELLQNKCYCSGPLRSARKGNPKEVVEARLKRGEVISVYNQQGVSVCKFKDKSEVLAISSEYGGELVDVATCQGRAAKKPEMIAKYNKYMKGVDSQQQMFAYYPVTYKTLRWYKQLAVYVFQIMLVNAHYLYSKCTKPEKKDLHNFQLEIVQCLLPKKVQMPKPPSSRVYLPSHLPKTTGRKMRKRCRYCIETKGKRIDTTFGCEDCPGNPGLCLKTCFRQFHGY